MISFQPGPSQVYPQLNTYFQDAFNDGILSINHRSDRFMEIMKQTVALLHQQLNIPEDYQIYFVSSATEAWEIIAQSLTHLKSSHIYNGDFGEKWADYTSQIVNNVCRMEMDLDEDYRDSMNSNSCLETSIICLTHNETSNGTQMPVQRKNHSQNHQTLIAVDATSSMAGVELEWLEADVWFASVQKCFGLPAGMALMVCSPNALKQANKIKDYKYYNSLLRIHENAEKFQTHCTPNVLNIYLLYRLLADLSTIEKISEATKTRAKAWYNFFEENGYELLVKNHDLRSETVIAVRDSPENIVALKNKALTKGFEIGNGYGNWKYDTFRIANFPAINDKQISDLKVVLKEILPQQKKQ